MVTMSYGSLLHHKRPSKDLKSVETYDLNHALTITYWKWIHYSTLNDNIGQSGCLPTVPVKTEIALDRGIDCARLSSRDAPDRGSSDARPIGVARRAGADRGPSARSPRVFDREAAGAAPRRRTARSRQWKGGVEPARDGQHRRRGRSEPIAGRAPCRCANPAVGAGGLRGTAGGSAEIRSRGAVPAARPSAPDGDAVSVSAF